MFKRFRRSHEPARLELRVYGELAYIKALEQFGVTVRNHRSMPENGLQNVNLTFPEGWTVQLVREFAQEVYDEKGRKRADILGPSGSECIYVRPFYRVISDYPDNKIVSVRVEDANGVLCHEFTIPRHGDWQGKGLIEGWEWLESQGIDHRNLTKYWD